MPAVAFAQGVARRAAGDGRHVPVNQQFGLNHHGVAVERRHVVEGAGRGFEMVGPWSAVHRRQQFGRRRIALRHRLPFGVEEIARAEMADEQEAAVEVLRMDFRHADAGRSQGVVDTDEGRNGARGMGDQRIRLAVAHRWPEHQFGRVHQDAWGVPVERDDLVGAGRGVADEMPAAGKAPAAAFEKGAHGERAGNALERRAGSRQPGKAAFATMLQFDHDRRGRQQPLGAVGPFDKGCPRRQRLIEAEFVQFRGRAEAVEVEMMHGQAGVVALHQREGGARHV